MKPCNKVSEDTRLECKEALANFKDQKTKRNELLQEIGMGPTSMHESALSKTIGTLGSGSGSGSGEPIPRGPMDKFTTSQPKQSTLNSKWKQKEKKEVCRKIGRFMYSKGLPFNTVNDPYWFLMMDAIANFGSGFKPPSMHELRTWILKEEDIGKLYVHATTLSRVLQVVNFIYGHTWVLSLMRTFTKNHGLLRPAITRFATAFAITRFAIAFLTLQSLYKQNKALIAMFSSEKWCSSTLAKKIAEKEDPLIPLDLCWLHDNELFNVDAIRVVSSNSQKTQASSDHMVSSHSYKRKHNEVPSTSGGKGKVKELNLTPIDEDEDLHEMGIHDSGHFPTIDTLDEDDDDDLGEEDLS
ncbi:hypothetical protein CK203_084290 [Vitis vinifera]|uniref:DUF659 domain-containing protein n=1 Tax=Vitis vinifera TaxID=29760 RepID=A0A438BMM4_VITVI|nr:hypothetical protein CK203_084290 [Vitis vinifera]